MKLDKKMKAVSLQQPWASLVVDGFRTIKYRRMPVNFRGTVYVYASQKIDLETDGGYEFLEAYYNDGKLYSDESIKSKVELLPRGFVIGTVDIVGCKEVGGTYEWYLENPIKFDEPIKPLHHAQPVWFYPFKW